jgi:phosphoribosylaminoimidazolecarboxamide formyltransferase/IMP cyclohydrolase
MFKNALISVSDKTGLIEFVKPLAANGMRIVSTGGTAQFLKQNGLNVVDISEQTGFPEVMGGRVKTLHPNVHMGLLSRPGNTDDDQILKKYQVQAFDLVVVNLYPFEETLLKNPSDAEMIEKIDIGGPSMLRSAAKNHQRITVVCDPNDYQRILEKKEMTVDDRRSLAAKVFMHTSCYDSLIAKSLNANLSEQKSARELSNGTKTNWELSSPISFAGREVVELRYGENPQQQAKWYKNLGNTQGLHSAKIIQGKALSYINLLDLDAATQLVRNLADASAVAVKHNNPCGVASRKNFTEAVELCLKSDPISVFGGIVACNQTIDQAEAELLSNIFLECVVAPQITDSALKIFSKKKNLRILIWPEVLKAQDSVEFKSIAGGFLAQQKDSFGSKTSEWKFIGEKPDSKILADLIFAEKVCASLKSNSIALVKDGQTLGLGMGQVNRVEAVEHAIHRMKTHHGNINSAIMASDAFFPFPDSVEVAAKAGVKWILQPGGSIKDEDVFATAERLKINMVITGVRHFRH